MAKRSLLLFLGIIVLVSTTGVIMAADTKEITWQVWVTPNLTKSFYESVAQAFEAKNPGISVQVIEANAGTEPNADNFIKTRIAAGNVPDLMEIITVASFADAGLLWEIPVNDPDLENVIALKSTMYNGKMYSFSAQTQPQGLIFYNKKLWAQAGLKETPKTWAEFEAACAKIKAKGLTPILTSGDWVSGFVFSLFCGEDVFSRNTQWYTDRFAQKVKFTDKEWRNAAAFFNRLVKKGYFNEGALSMSYSDLEPQFFAGKAVMYPMGSWFAAAEAKATKDFEVGVFLVPSQKGARHLLDGQNFGNTAIYAKSKNAQEAWKLWKFYRLDPVYGAKALEVDSLFSSVKGLSYPMSPVQQEIQAIINQAVSTSSHFNNKVGSNPPNGIADVYIKVGQSFLTGKVTDIKGTLSSLDDFWKKSQ